MNNHLQNIFYYSPKECIVSLKKFLIFAFFWGIAMIFIGCSPCFADMTVTLEENTPLKKAHKTNTEKQTEVFIIEDNLPITNHNFSDDGAEQNEDFPEIIVIDNDVPLKDKIRQTLSENKPIQTPITEKIRLKKIEQINHKDMTEELSHELYEEQLPEDTILSHPKEKNQKVLTTDKVNVPTHKHKKIMIAIVIDDMGINHRRTAQISSLNFPLTASFLTYGTKLKSQVEASRKAGHEIIAHLPMQPHVSVDISPDMLTTDMNPKEVKKGLNVMLDKFEHIVGVNNHMGSLFTEDKIRMNIVMTELKKRNLFFLDSKTTSHSVGQATANKNKVDYVARNVFLDNKNQFDYIMQQLQQTEQIAQKNGYAIAIGHPKKQTYLALKKWLPQLQERGIHLVHLSEIVQKLNQHH